MRQLLALAALVLFGPDAVAQHQHGKAGSTPEAFTAAPAFAPDGALWLARPMADRIVVLREGEIRQVGTPEELYARPARADVADFMGFRNRIAGAVKARNGDEVTLDIGGIAVTGLAREAIEGKGLAMMRPDDLVASLDAAPDALPATVEAIEYRGRDFFGSARLANGAEAFFRAPKRLAAGDVVHLAPEPGKVLIFAGGQG